MKLTKYYFSRYKFELEYRITLLSLLSTDLASTSEYEDIPELLESIINDILNNCDDNGEIEVQVQAPTSPLPPPPPPPAINVSVENVSPLPPPPSFELLAAFNYETPLPPPPSPEVIASAGSEGLSMGADRMHVSAEPVNVGEDDVCVGADDVFVDESQVSVADEVSELHFPSKLKVRGRPKGSNTTNVIGTRRKGYRVRKFSHKTMIEKENLALKMLVKTPVRGKKRVYDSDDIKDFADVSSAVTDDDFDVGLVTRRLSDSARAKVARVVTVKRDMGDYICPVCKDICGDGDGDRASVYCDSCMEWIHIFPCSGERKKPADNNKSWFCAVCRKTQ